MDDCAVGPGLLHRDTHDCRNRRGAGRTAGSAKRDLGTIDYRLGVIVTANRVVASKVALMAVLSTKTVIEWSS